QIRMFFKPPSAAPQVLDCPLDKEGRWQHPIEWPDKAELAKVVLFFGDREIETTNVHREVVRRSVRLAVDDYFDPGRKRLEKLLFDKNAQGFEMAVVRLFNLLGVPLIWYGKGATLSGRSDTAAYLADLGYQGIVLLGECTRERPDAKFSA